MGHARRADRHQRAPAHRRRRPHRGRAQRHHRERRAAPGRARQPRRDAGQRHRHRGARAHDRRRGHRRGQPGGRGPPGAAPRGRHLRPGRAGHPEPERARGGAQRQPHRAGHRRVGDVRGLRRGRPGPLHQAGGLPRRRRGGYRPRQRLPRGLTRRGWPPRRRRQGAHHRGGRRRRLRARPVRGLHAQGDPRAARGAAPRPARPARRPVLHRPAGRDQPGRAPAPVDQAGQVPGLRLGLLRGPDGRGAGRGAGPHPVRRRAGLGVQVPQPGGGPGHAVRGGQPVRRDPGHADGGTGAAPQGRSGHRGGQRGGQRDRARVRPAGCSCTPARRSRSPPPRR